MQGDTGSIPGQGTKIPHARQRGKKKKKKNFFKYTAEQTGLSVAP